MPKREKTASKINNPHDTFICKILKQKQEAISLLRGILPESLKQNMVFDNFQLSPDTYVSAALRKSFTDVIYDGYYQEASQSQSNKIKIAFIIEHKSFLPAHHFKLQLLNYFSAVINQQFAQNINPPALPIMIVLYHGEKDWVDEPLWKLFGEVPEDLRAHIPDFKYHLSNFKEYSDETINNLFDSIELRATMLMMRDIYAHQLFETAFMRILSQVERILGNERGREFFDALLTYIQAVSTELYQQAENIIINYKQKGEPTMTIVEKMRKKGRKEGIKEGIKEGELITKAKNALRMMKKGMDNTIIAEITELPEITLNLLRALYDRFDLDAINHIKITSEGIDMV